MLEEQTTSNSATLFFHFRALNRRPGKRDIALRADHLRPLRQLQSRERDRLLCERARGTAGSNPGCSGEESATNRAGVGFQVSSPPRPLARVSTYPASRGDRDRRSAI